MFERNQRSKRTLPRLSSEPVIVTQDPSDYEPTLHPVAQNIMSEKMRRIQSAWTSSDLNTVRELVGEELKTNPSAEVYYWAARVALDIEQRTMFLRNALALDPFHAEALAWLRRIESSQLVGNMQPAAVSNVNVHVINQLPSTTRTDSKKSRLTAFLLILFFGPLGMFYSTISGAIVMLIVGLGLVAADGSLAFLVWIVSMIWGVAAVKE
jgi:hypothetical protein